MNSTIKHIHIGAGKLGLGMVGDVMNSIGIHSTFLNRESPSKSELYAKLMKERRYSLKIDQSEYRTVEPIDLKFLPDVREEIDNLKVESDLLKIMIEPEALFLTTSVRRENLKSIVPYLVKGIRERQLEDNKLKKQLIVIACENISKNSAYLNELIVENSKKNGLDEDFFNYLKSNVIFCNTIVDRICLDPSIESESGCVTVDVERDYEWIIGLPILNRESLNIFEMFKNQKNVRLIRDMEISFYEKRKLWLVNGIQLALATYAYNSYKGNKKNWNEVKIRKLNEALGISIIDEKIRKIQTGFALALQFLAEEQMEISDISQLSSLDEFNARVYKRLKDNRQDSLARIIDYIVKLDVGIEKLRNICDLSEKNNPTKDKILEFCKTVDIYNFMNKIKERIAEPIEIIFEIEKIARPEEKPKFELYFFGDLLLKTIFLLNDATRIYSNEIETFEI